MNGVPVHTTSPINPNSASKQNGARLSTAAARYSPADSTPRTSPSPVTAPANPVVLPSPTYARVQPISTAVAASTETPHSPLTSQSIQGVTSSTLSTGAVSMPSTPQSSVFPSASYSEARRVSVPPPPKVGEVPKPAAYYAPQYQGDSVPTSPRVPSLKTSLPPLVTHQIQGTPLTPTRAQTPSAVTSHATPTSMTHDLSHPPGYVQDHRTSFSERLPEFSSPISPIQNGHGRGRSRNGILDGGGGNGDVEDDDKGLWSTAVSWAKTVGEKVIESEEEVWKRINGPR